MLVNFLTILENLKDRNKREYKYILKNVNKLIISITKVFINKYYISIKIFFDNLY